MLKLILLGKIKLTKAVGALPQIILTSMNLISYDRVRSHSSIIINQIMVMQYAPFSQIVMQSYYTL